MQISMTAAIAAALLAFTSQVSGQATFPKVIGDADPEAVGSALGYEPDAPRDGSDKLPFHRDVAVFSSPMIAPTDGTLWAGKPRIWFSMGCGSTLGVLNHYYSTNDAYSAEYAKASPEQKSKAFYQFPARALLDWRKLTTEMARNKKIPKATAGGNLKITVHEINHDGAGPYRCRIDSLGTAIHWGSWVTIPDGANVPGDDKTDDYTLTISIPEDQKCAGTYEGIQNVCMLRCENQAKAGPFGGCFPFSLA
ncbi:hypothetical protein ABW20_dc0107630 [Dactylellina cionopaga]|nr:hypothetical protein ABW20_dc0107630 [Dactylellina cionopaga]